ncbi:MAG: porin [Xanthomonadales bacterium]|jgi:predicted porin|nr:porin [Xanthomonadales bacterium]
MRRLACLFAFLLTVGTLPAVAQEQGNAGSDTQPTGGSSEEAQTEDNRVQPMPASVQGDVDTNEDPDAKRVEEMELGEKQEAGTWDGDLYGSARLHTINLYDIETGSSDRKLADGASRIGASGSWQASQGWSVFGRLEYGISMLDTVTSKAQTDSGGNLNPRLHNLALESKNLFVKYGKSWSTYYQVAGAADRFSIFGGDAAGVYNAGTDGGATGTGRSDDAIQTNVFLDFSRWAHIKPFKLNAQYQHGESIPHAEGLNYGSAYSLSAWFETRQNIGFGLAWHDAGIDSADRSALSAIGIDGDAQALALAFKAYGDRWLASLVLVDMKNLETTDQDLYFDGRGVELFAQWAFRKRWWLIGGGNWLVPDSDELQAGQYEVKYTVLGLRYALDSFKHMFFLEWRDDHGKRADGLPNENQLTVGFRWDLG